MASLTDIPHFAFPFTFDHGSAVVLEQDSVDDVAQCVQVLLSTPVGSRLELPEYGVIDPTFVTTVNHDNILTAIGDWEPRAVAQLLESPDAMDELIRHVQITVTNQGESG